MRSFFRIYKEKFWRLTLLNVVCFCLTLPLLYVLYVCINAAAGVSTGDAVVDILPGVGFYMTLFSVQSTTGRAFLIAAVVASALLFGPLKFVMAGVHCACFSGRYRYFADVLSMLRRKLPQAFLLGTIDVLVLGRLLLNLSGIQLFAHNPALGSASVLLRVVSLIALLFWFQIRRYFYILAFAAELGTWALLKNSLILSVSEFGRCSKATAASVLIWALTFLTLPLVTVILLPLCAGTAASLANVCCLYPVVEQRVLRRPDEDN